MPDAALLLVEKGIGKNRWVGLYDTPPHIELSRRLMR